MTTDEATMITNDEVNQITDMTIKTMIHTHHSQIEDDVLKMMNDVARIAGAFTMLKMKEKIETIISKHQEE